MNQIKVLLIGLIALWCIFGGAYGKPQGKGPASKCIKKRFVCKEDGLFKEPSNCGIYYMCSNGKRYDQQCPGGTYFDDNKKRCEWDLKKECPK